MTNNYYMKKWVKRLLEYTPVHEPACVVETAYVELKDFSGAPISKFIVYPDRLGWDEVRHDSLVTRFSPGFRCYPGCEPEEFDTEAYAKEWLRKTRCEFKFVVCKVEVKLGSDAASDKIDVAPLPYHFLTLADAHDFAKTNDYHIIDKNDKYINVTVVEGFHNLSGEYLERHVLHIDASKTPKEDNTPGWTIHSVPLP